MKKNIKALVIGYLFFLHWTKIWILKKGVISISFQFRSYNYYMYTYKTGAPELLSWWSMANTWFQLRLGFQGHGLEAPPQSGFLLSTAMLGILSIPLLLLLPLPCSRTLALVPALSLSKTKNYKTNFIYICIYVVYLTFLWSMWKCVKTIPLS